MRFVVGLWDLFRAQLTGHKTMFFIMMAGQVSLEGLKVRIRLMTKAKLRHDYLRQKLLRTLWAWNMTLSMYHFMVNFETRWITHCFATNITGYRVKAFFIASTERETVEQNSLQYPQDNLLKTP